jgi:serine/threonine-protein kinase
VPDPRTLRPDLPSALAELILGLLEKDPKDRPQTAAAVLEALTRIEPTNRS